MITQYLANRASLGNSSASPFLAGGCVPPKVCKNLSIFLVLTTFHLPFQTPACDTALKGGSKNFPETQTCLFLVFFPRLLRGILGSSSQPTKRQSSGRSGLHLLGLQAADPAGADPPLLRQKDRQGFPTCRALHVHSLSCLVKNGGGWRAGLRGRRRRGAGRTPLRRLRAPAPGRRRQVTKW